MYVSVYSHIYTPRTPPLNIVYLALKIDISRMIHTSIRLNSTAFGARNVMFMNVHSHRLILLSPHIIQRKSSPRGGFQNFIITRKTPPERGGQSLIKSRKIPTEGGGFFRSTFYASHTHHITHCLTHTSHSFIMATSTAMSAQIYVYS